MRNRPGGYRIDQDDPQEGPHSLKQLKVKIPLRYHVRLHSLKILTGRQISDVVTEAIVDYIDEVEAEHGALDGVPPGQG